MPTSQLEESGTFFVLPPHHRLFAVFDDPVAGAEIAETLRAERAADDVWTFFGNKGIQSLDPGIGHHGVPVGIVRVVQRLLTNDCEYCDGLATALGRGAMVVAVRVERHEVEEVSARLHARGAHSLAYGEHWNFVPLRGEEHTVGFFGAEEPGAPGAAEPEAAEPGSGAA